MCGIVGWVGNQERDCPKRLMKSMCDILAHRGPDDEGFYFGKGIGFGHRRLSIIDLSHGHQPMTTKDGRYTIIYNGEVYNYPAICHQLEQAGFGFETKSDVEVLLKAFQNWGTNAFDKFQGMFAIAIWDETERVLHLVRDHLGIKPLYYVEIDGELLFASEIKSLFCHPKVKRRLDPETIAVFLTFNNSFGNKSFWSEIKSCQPGERLEWRNGCLRSFSFFDVGSWEVEPFKGKLDQAADRYLELLDSSVKDHLISDVPVGTYLSSGIDSCSIGLMAAAHQKMPISAFTGYFTGKENGWFDERFGAGLVADKGGMEHHHCPITWNDFHVLMEKTAYHLDEPTLGSGAIPQFIVAGQVRKKVKVVLTGHGGDEMFAGYPVFKAILMRQNGVGINSLKSLRSIGGLDELIRIIYFLFGGLYDRILARGQVRIISDAGFSQISSSVLNALIKRRGGVDQFLLETQPFESKADVDGLTRWYIGTYLPTLLKQEDKISMAHGLESRTPICYKPLVRLSLSLSGTVKLDKGRLKSVPRKALQSVLPPQLYSLPKRGFPTPIVSWLAGKLGEEWEAGWQRKIPSPLEEWLDPPGVCKQFHWFRKWGHKLPGAYASAHRLVSLQILFACAKTLDEIPVVSDDMSEKELKGSTLLGI